MKIRLKRAYDPPAEDDGFRVLVDRIWPRGVSKKQARLDDWLQEVAPSDKLRQWFSHDPEKWSGFVQKYFKELDDKRDVIEKLRGYAAERPLTLVFGARDQEHNNAAALKRYLQKEKEV